MALWSKLWQTYRWRLRRRYLLARALRRRRRLTALGVPEAKVKQMDHERIRLLIAKPALIKIYVK